MVCKMRSCERYLRTTQRLNSLISISEHPGLTPSANQDAKSLAKKLHTFGIALMCTIWNDLLQNLNVEKKATKGT